MNFLIVNKDEFQKKWKSEPLRINFQHYQSVCKSETEKPDL